MMKRVKPSRVFLGPYSTLLIYSVIVAWSLVAVCVLVWNPHSTVMAPCPRNLLKQLRQETSLTVTTTTSFEASATSDAENNIIFFHPLTVDGSPKVDDKHAGESNGWRYSFTGDLSWINPLELSRGFGSERYEDQQERLSSWKTRLDGLMVKNRDDVRISAWPISGGANCNAYRTAIRVNNKLYVATPLQLIGCSPIDQPYNATCSVPFEGVECQVQGKANRHLILTLSDDVGSVPYFDISIQGEGFGLLVEEPPVQQGTVHVCVHGVLYPEKIFGLTPDEHFELFWAHYARFGVSDIHLYTNSTVYLDVASRLKRIKGATLWFHETPLPRLAVDPAYLQPEELKSQYFATNECIVRARAMGASMVLIHDLDEFVFPQTSLLKPSIKLQDIMQIELERAQVQEQKGLILWMQSYLFNTILCSPSKSGKRPDWYHNFLDHFQAAQLDSSTYQGRRKSMLIYNDVPMDILLKELWYGVHDVYVNSNSIQVRAARIVHLHHYRESWHKNVCSGDFDAKKHQPWKQHSGCDDNLDETKSVYFY